VTDTAPSGSGAEPKTKRTITFIDGQNLYHHARAAFNVTHPNYDVMALSHTICKEKSWFLKQVRFYTGTPEAAEDPRWNAFWSKKLLTLKRQGVHTFSRRLRYRDREIKIGEQVHLVRVAEEKGIDVRIALDCVGLALNEEYEVALIFSQDQDMSEVVDEIKKISRIQKRWIRVACAFPLSASASNRRGINGAEWIPIDQATYERCVDPRDYR
jgi:uncharacterized LabA/DUF88 family protein